MREKMLIKTEYNQVSRTNVGTRIGKGYHKMSDFWHVPTGFWKLAGALDWEFDEITSANGSMNRKLS